MAGCLGRFSLQSGRSRRHGLFRMKQFLLTLAAVLVGGFLALLGYDRFVVQPRESAVAKPVDKATDAAPAVPVDMGKARAEAREVAAEVEASVQRSVDNAREAMTAQASEMDRRSLISDAVQRVTMFRVGLTEFHMTNGRWPVDAEEAGLPPPADMRGGAVREVTLAEQGVVNVALDDRFGKGSAIVLRPTANTVTGQIEWACEVKGDDEIRRALPRCK
ncbi:MAG: pilin [Xanthomonadaceae bacterium]|nr:pilin [Xanthomonadaceae bacterium]